MPSSYLYRKLGNIKKDIFVSLQKVISCRQIFPQFPHVGWGTFSVWPVSKTFETLSKLSIKWKNCELWTKTCSKEEKLLPNNKFIPNMGTQVWGWNQKKEKVLNLWLISGLEEKLASGLLFEEKLNLKIMRETKSLNFQLGQSQRKASPLFHSTNH